MIEPGRAFALIMLIALTAIIIYFIRRSRDGYVPNIRPIAGLDAIEEAVGRATEMGRPVHYTPGTGSLSGSTAAMTFASLEILSVVAKTIARYGAKLIVSIKDPTVFPLAEETVKQAYMAEGAIELFSPDTVRYLSAEQFAYAAGVLGLLQREQAAANILLGAFWAESLIIAETGNAIGAIQIAGTARLTQIPFFAAACDYVLIGEELYAASAMCSKNPVKLGSIAGQDIGKIIAVSLLACGAILETFGISFLSQLLGK